MVLCPMAGFLKWDGRIGKAEGESRGEFGRLLLEAVKKFPAAYAEFLRLAEREEAAREARSGCERCRGRRVIEDGEA